MLHLLAAVACRARYRGINTDKSKVAQFQRAEGDTGSSEVQIAQLTARVAQLTSHLQTHRKDYASTRGLMKVCLIHRSVHGFQLRIYPMGLARWCSRLSLRPEWPEDMLQPT